jgi:transposase
MANRAKKIKTSKGLSLKIVNTKAAGIDIATTEMQVCVPADRDGENNRKFGCFTKDLQEVSFYLRACGIETVAMESTGIYWLPLFIILKEDGFDVILVNPRDIESYKTAEADVE